jgi:hypothetical protein
VGKPWARMHADGTVAPKLSRCGYTALRDRRHTHTDTSYAGTSVDGSTSARQHVPARVSTEPEALGAVHTRSMNLPHTTNSRGNHVAKSTTATRVHAHVPFSHQK